MPSLVSFQGTFKWSDSVCKLFVKKGQAISQLVYPIPGTWIMTTLLLSHKFLKHFATFVPKTDSHFCCQLEVHVGPPNWWSLFTLGCRYNSCFFLSGDSLSVYLCFLSAQKKYVEKNYPSESWDVLWLVFWLNFFCFLKSQAPGSMANQLQQQFAQPCVNMKAMGSGTICVVCQFCFQP